MPPHHRAPHEYGTPQDDEPSFASLLRDLVVFEVKLFMDGLKDIVLAQGAVAAVVVGFFRRRRRAGPLHALMRFGERFDRWLRLYEPDTPGFDGERRPLGTGEARMDERDRS